MSTATSSISSRESFDNDWCSLDTDEIQSLDISQITTTKEHSVPLQTIRTESIKTPAPPKNYNLGGSWTVVTLQSAREDCVHDLDRSDIELSTKERLQVIAGASARLTVAPLQGLMARSRRYRD